MVVAVGFTACTPPVVPRRYDVPSLPVIVNWVAFVAAIVRTEVYPLATVVGVAVIVTVGTFRVPLPENRAQPDKTQLSAINPEPRRNRNILRATNSLAKVVSLHGRE